MSRAADPGRTSHRVSRGPQRLAAPNSGSPNRPTARFPLLASISRGTRHPDPQLFLHGTSDGRQRVNLGAATRRLSRTLQPSLTEGKDARAIAEDLIEDGKQIASEDVGRNKAMAKWGGDWLVEQKASN